MNGLQNGEHLGMVGKGTLGGQPRVDGSDIEPGVHLRWQMAPELSFPPQGFDVYRREENYRQFLRCGVFREIDLGGVAWLPYSDDHYRAGFSITFSGETQIVRGCGLDDASAAAFPGDQAVRFDFAEPVRFVRILFDGRTPANPLAEAYWQSSTGDVLMASQRARRRGRYRLLRLFADRIDHLILRGRNMVICEVCFVLVEDGYHLGWPQIPLNGGTPIYLPITHPEWNSPHPHTPDDQAEAEARLPVLLPSPKLQAYAQGFQDELHPIIYDLVSTEPQHLFRLKEGDLDTAASLDWPGMSLLQLMAVDPNIARILGLYWHDDPPSPTRFYDYRLIAHYGSTPFPSQQVDFADLPTGIRYGPAFTHNGLTYASPNPIEVAQTTWNGSEHTGLLFTRTIAASPVSIALPELVPSISLRAVAAGAVWIKGFRGYKEQFSEIRPAGDLDLLIEDNDGINKIYLYPLGELTLVEIVLRPKAGGIGDLIYDVYHLRSRTPYAISVPTLEPPQVLETSTGLDENGRLLQNQSRVGLQWERGEAGGRYLRAVAPVLFHIQREDLAADGETVLQTSLLNETAPTLVSEQTGAGALYSDRSVADGIYTYAVRGIDLFGVLGDWSPAREIEVQDRRAPPPPQAVQAQYLDPADPWLSQEDQDWAAANGPGLKLAWQWPGLFALQAPDVAPPDAEYRAYATQGVLNTLTGSVTAVTSHGGTSEVATDLDWPGAADALVGESLRINQNFFTVSANTQGPNCTLTVDDLTTPDLAPVPGPCTLTYSPERSYWRDYRAAFHWQQRLHTEPVQEIPSLSAVVVAVEDFDAAALESDSGTVSARDGAERTVTLDQGLQDPAGTLLPGVLLCNGIVYPAYAHSLGATVQIHLVPVGSPADRSTRLEPALGSYCEYFSGRQYEMRIPGFTLDLPPGQATVQAQIAMSCSDGKTHSIDDPRWAQPGRGGLGDRPGNESALSPAVTVQAVQRTPPAAVANVPAAPPEPIFAQPANYYGQARYTLTWEAVAEATGYAVYRGSGAALFDQDRVLRQEQKGYYQTGSVFADDPGFAAWLTEFDPALTEAEMLANVDDHLGAWRAWSGQFYTARTDAEIQALADRPGNEAAFQRLNKETVSSMSLLDTFDGRGRGFYLYRVRTVDAAGNLSAWSATYPPVHIFAVTPPATPVVTAVHGGERSITIAWRANRETDLHAYHLWSAGDPNQLADVRRLPPHAVLTPTSGAPIENYQANGLVGGETRYFRLAAVDAIGNISPPTEILIGQAVDTSMPLPPVWVSAAWDADGTGVWAEWLLQDPSHEVMVERSFFGINVWTPVSPWLSAGTIRFQDVRAQTTLAYEYRLVTRNDSGNIGAPSAAVHVDAFDSGS